MKARTLYGAMIAAALALPLVAEAQRSPTTKVATAPATAATNAAPHANKPAPKANLRASSDALQKQSELTAKRKATPLILPEQGSGVGEASSSNTNDAFTPPGTGNRRATTAAQLGLQRSGEVLPIEGPSQ